jgi:photosystem II stability/assembly factor-like uncharacterized protein
MARLSRTTRLIVALGALALLGALGLGFTLLRLAEDPWEFLGPAEGDVTSLVFDPTTPTTLYAATDYYGGVYKSEDGGTTWRYLRGSRELEGGFLAIAPTTPATLYVYGRGVYKSADGGETWRAVNRGLGLIWVSALSIDPTNPRVVFAGTRNGVYKSTDGGESWRAVNRGLELGEGNWVSALSVDPTNPRVVFAGTDAGVYKSDDGGETWTSTGLNKKVWDVFIDPANPQVLVARTDKGVIRSADGGETWRSADGLPAKPAKDVSSLLRAPTGVMYVSYWEDCSHLYRSTDGGATWNRVDIIEILLASPLDRCPSWRTLRLLAVDPNAPATLYASLSYSGGLLRSSDDGVSWRPAGLHHTVLSLALTPSSLYAGTSEGGVYRSDDRGLTWRAASEGLTGFSVSELAVDPTTPTTLYASTDNGVHKSDDGGLTWRAVGLSGQRVRTLAVIPTTPTTLYAGVSYGDEPGVYKSVDGGETWLAAGLPGQRILTLAVDPTTPTTLYAGVREGGVQRSDDGGATWRAVGLPGRTVRALAIHPVEPATLYAGTDDRGENALFRSADGGATWSESVRTTGIIAVVIDPNAPETVYAANENGEILRSTDGGATWSREKGSSIFRTPLSLLLVTDPAQPPAIYVGTSISGVWRLAIDKARWAPYP